MSDSSSKLQTVIDRLPFAVDDTDAANDAYRRWVEEDDAKAERLVDMWTYSYVCRYFLSKSAQGSFNNPSDADELTTRAYHKVQKNRDSVRKPNRYANWVSVVCKNTFLNYTRRNQFSESIEDEDGPTLTAETEEPVAEVGFVREAFDEAIDRLPEYLQKPARLYFLENRGFEEISDVVGKPVATVRTYKHKAIKHLRTDERLQEYIDRPTGTEGEC
ncbi:MAG: RNA polymerase sigma factor [Salinibacter sp.]